MSSQAFKLFLSTIAFTAIVLTAGPSFADLMVVPQRVVMDVKNRSTVLLLLNTDKTPHTYRMSWKLTTMDENGKYKNLPVDEKDPHSPANMVVFSPRQVSLEGNGRQNIRLSLRMPADLPPGEYRAHLVLSALPDEEDQKSAAPKEKGVSFGLHFLVGTSIPVIVRTGGPANDAKLTNISLQTLPDNKGKQLHIDLTHTKGANSAYGRILVFADKEQIGVMSNVALFPEMDKRILDVPLTATPTPGSQLRIVYEGAAEYAGKVLAEESLTTPR